MQGSERSGLAEVMWLTLSAGTTADTVQMALEGHLKKRRRLAWGAEQDKRLILFVDDLNMPKQDQFGAQPPLEFIRSLQVCFYRRAIASVFL
jgi:dynein heavy chain